MTPAEAKAWLIQQILAEAERTGTTLDALEAAMLEYSETARTPANLEALNEAFDQAHDQRDYETKIAALIHSTLAVWREENSPKLARWNDAIRVLRKEDHYLLNIIVRAHPQAAAPKKQQAERSLLKLFLLAVLLAIAVTLLLGYLARHAPGP